jgi:ketosteroid isomerase-like protein
MSQENVEAIRRAAEAFNRGDIDALLREVDPEVEWHPLLQVLLGGETTVYLGHERARELYRDIDEAFTDTQVELSEVRDLGERVVAIGHLRARPGKWRRDRDRHRLAGRLPERQGGPGTRIPRPQRSPRSRRAVGVGDVAGGRGARPQATQARP